LAQRFAGGTFCPERTKAMDVPKAGKNRLVIAIRVFA
jgi:hypothetical protein